MNRIPPSILNTLQHREFYRHTPPPFTFTQSSMSASQPVVQSLNSGASSDNKTASTYPGKRPAKVPRHPPLVRTVSGTQPPNAAAAAQFAAITQEAAQQTSHAAKPPFHPFHPGLTPEWIQRTQFSDRVKELLKGYVDWPVGTDQQAVNLIALRNAGFTMTPDDRNLAKAIKAALLNATGLKLSTRDPSKLSYSGIIYVQPPNSSLPPIPLRVTIVCAENKHPRIIQAHPLP
jgi:hypothetical protein